MLTTKKDFNAQNLALYANIRTVFPPSMCVRCVLNVKEWKCRTVTSHDSAIFVFTIFCSFLELTLLVAGRCAWLT
jgi:hypothetical protein